MSDAAPSLAEWETAEIESANASGRTPVVFVHGLWLLSSSWQPWRDLFEDNGFATLAPGWPDDPATVAEARDHPEAFAKKMVQQVTDHYLEAIAALDRAPVVIGHSFGGLIAQKIAGEGVATVTVSIDNAPFKGVLPLPVSSLRVASVALRNPANRKRTVALTPAQFRYGFTNTRTETESAELYGRCAMPSPGRTLFQTATANFSPATATKVDLSNSTRGPLLITQGGHDHTVAPAIPMAAYKLHKKHSTAVTQLHTFPDADHSLCINSDWREVADVVLGWLKQQGR